MMADVTRDALVQAARGWIGTPYRHQASLKHVGCDCLGLLRGVWRDVFGDEPEAPPAYDAGWLGAGGEEPLAEAAARHLVAVAPGAMTPGDVLLFRMRAHWPARHCAILTTPTAMIHAHDGASVAEVALSGWWRRHVAMVFRFPGVM
jgi:NlpC/P60 family putative phage cell wall peptidase